MASYVYDPEKNLSESHHVDVFHPNSFSANLINAMDKGAVGFIGILTNYIDSNALHNRR